MPHVCPWWGGCFIDNPLRRRFHNPLKIVRPYVEPGMTVMDVGCGMGFCSIVMAKVEKAMECMLHPMADAVPPARQPVGSPIVARTKRAPIFFVFQRARVRLYCKRAS
jgi:hypothetical protein